MSKVKVTGSLKIKHNDVLYDLIDYGSPATTTNDARSKVNLDSNNPYLFLSNYNQRCYATVGNSSNSSELTVATHGYQWDHGLYLGKFDDNYIWIAENGFRPNYTLKHQITTSGTYTLKYNAKNKTTSITGGTSISIPSAVFYILLQGAGGGGSGSTGQKYLWVFGWTAQVWTGSGGGSGATVAAILDMSKLGTVTITLGAGGTGGTNKDSAGGTGGITQLTAQNKTVSLSGGTGGIGRYGFANKDYSTEYHDAFNYTSNNKGSGGTYTIPNPLPEGLYILNSWMGLSPGDTWAASTSTDKYGGLSYNYSTRYSGSNGYNQGGAPSALSRGPNGNYGYHVNNDGQSGSLGAGGAGGGDTGLDSGAGPWHNNGGKGGNAALYIYY